MEKRKPISLNHYIIRLLIRITLGIFLILSLSVFILMTLLMSGVLSPANAGEVEAHADISRIRQTKQLDNEFNPQFYDYVVFDSAKQVRSSSLNDKKTKQVTQTYKQQSDTRNNEVLLPLAKGEEVFIRWDYKTQLTNPQLRTFIPHPGMALLILTLLALTTFLSLFIHKSNKKIQQDVVLIKQASQQIANQNLATPILTKTKIKEFNTTLDAMENLRHSLEDSLAKEWEIKEQRKHDIAALSHDIKTPLTAILGNTELLLEDDITPEQTQLLTDIYHAGIKTKTYIDTLQKTNQETHLDEEKIEISLQQIMDEVKKVLSPLIYAKRIHLGYDYNPQDTIYGVPSLLTRALINIGENAINHTSEGNILFSVTKDHGHTTFIVIDEGHGFSKEALIHGTNMFWQQDKSRSKYQHYGIGLAFVEHVATLHGGSLTLSNTNSGACVTLSVADMINITSEN